MPVFDVFRINEKQLAKVKVVRGDNMVLTVKIAPRVKTTGSEQQMPFAEWKKHVSKKCHPKRHLTAALIEHVYN